MDINLHNFNKKYFFFVVIGRLSLSHFIGSGTMANKLYVVTSLYNRDDLGKTTN